MSLGMSYQAWSAALPPVGDLVGIDVHTDLHGFQLVSTYGLDSDLVTEWYPVTAEGTDRKAHAQNINAGFSDHAGIAAVKRKYKCQKVPQGSVLLLKGVPAGAAAGHPSERVALVHGTPVPKRSGLRNKHAICW